MKTTATLLILVTGLFTGCELDITDRISPPPVPESARLVDQHGRELTPEIQLRTTWPSMVEMQLFDGSGKLLSDLPGHRAELFWGPTGAVHLDTVPGRPFARSVTVLNPCATPRTVRIGYGREPSADQRIFGPFPVQISDPVRSVRIIGRGVDLTPSIQLPNARDILLEIRLLNCQGQRVTQLGEGEEIRLFWAPDGLVAEGMVVDQPLQRIVFARLPVGETGSVSVGLARTGEAPAQVFGPFPVVVVP